MTAGPTTNLCHRTVLRAPPWVAASSPNHTPTQDEELGQSWTSYDRSALLQRSLHLGFIGRARAMAAPQPVENAARPSSWAKNCERMEAQSMTVRERAGAQCRDRIERRFKSGRTSAVQNVGAAGHPRISQLRAMQEIAHEPKAVRKQSWIKKMLQVALQRNKRTRH